MADRPVRPRAVAALALLLASGLSSAACTRTADRPASVVVFVVDTLRRDHLGSYGYPRDVSPVIDALATQGVVFEEAVTVAPRTWQSFTSLLTGLYPPRHGVRYIFSQALGSEIATLSGLLGEAGYHTAAFDGMTFLREMTGGRAFQAYFDPSSLGGKMPMIDDDHMIEAFLEWLGEARDPFFAFLRLSSPHWPYLCDPVFHGEVVDHASIDHSFNCGEYGLQLGKGGLVMEDADTYRARFYQLDLSPTEFEHMILHYDECVHASDRIIGRAVERLKALDLFDHTIVVITADHGEAFGEHGYMQHGPRVDGPVMQIPLIVRFPPMLASGRRGIRVGQLVRIVDLFPTLVRVLGLDPPPGLDGRDLLPALDHGEDLALSAYGEAGRGFAGLDPERFLPGVAGKARMFRTLRWKLVYIPDGKQGISRLYDLEADPEETRDVSAQHPDVAARLRAGLAEVMAAGEDGDSTSEPVLTDEEKERLRALGYL